MPKLWHLEGHSWWPPLPGPVTSTWQTEAGVHTSGRRIQLLRRWFRRGCRKGQCEPRFQFKGPDSAQLLGGPSRLVTTQAHEDTVEGRDKAGPPLWQTGRRKGEGKSTKEAKSREGAEEQEATVLRVAAPLFCRGRSATLMGQGCRAPMPSGPWEPGTPKQGSPFSGHRKI